MEYLELKIDSFIIEIKLIALKKKMNKRLKKKIKSLKKNLKKSTKIKNQ